QALRIRTDLSVLDRRGARGRPVHGPVRLAPAGPIGDRADAGGQPTADRGARLHVVLPPPRARGTDRASPRAADRAAGARPDRVRVPRERVPAPDGPIARGDACGGRGGADRAGVDRLNAGLTEPFGGDAARAP